MDYFAYMSEDPGWKNFDLSIVTHVVGRIKLMNRKWGIIDWSEPACWPQLVEPGDIQEDMDDLNDIS